MSARVEQAPEVASLWSVRELVDLLASVWADLDEEEALAVTVARCVEILGAEVAAVVADGRVAAVAGADDGDLLAVADGRKGIVELPWAGVSQAVSVAVEDERPGRLLIVRKQPLGPQELDLLRGLARVLSISLRMHRTLAQVRAQAEENERLAERLCSSV